MVTFQSSSFIDYIYTNLLRGTVEVYMQSGSVYAYENVSRRAILNLRLQPNLSLGSWFNVNCDKAERVSGKFVPALSTWFMTLTRTQLIDNLVDEWRLLCLEEYDEDDESPEDYRDSLESFSLDELRSLWNS